MKFDEKIKAIIELSYHKRQDVFLRVPFPSESVFSSGNVKTAVFLPSAFSCTEPCFLGDVKEDFCEFGKITDNLIFSDVRYLNVSEFREFLIKNGYRRFVLMFAECAFIGEYGYRESFRWTGEIKGETEEYIQTVAFFSASQKDYQVFRDIFACSEVLIVDDKINLSPCIYKVASVHEKHAFALDEAAKHVCKRSCVMFNSRNEALEFTALLRKRKIPVLYFDGGLSTENRKMVLDEFSEGRTLIMAATKSYFSSALSCPPDEMILCGAPFSVSHIGRMAEVAKGNLSLVYCEEDFIRNRKIIKAFSTYFDDDVFEEKRLEAFSEAADFIHRRT